MTATVRHFDTSLIFSGMAEVGFAYKYETMVEVTDSDNTLSYYAREIIIPVKSFITLDQNAKTF